MPRSVVCTLLFSTRTVTPAAVTGCTDTSVPPTRPHGVILATSLMSTELVNPGSVPQQESGSEHSAVTHCQRNAVRCVHILRLNDAFRRAPEAWGSNLGPENYGRAG